MVREKELTLTCYEWLIVVAWLNQKRNRFITAQYNIFLFFPPLNPKQWRFLAREKDYEFEYK